MCSLVDYCQAIDEKCGKFAQVSCGIVQTEFWCLSDSYISDEKCVVENRVDARNEWHRPDSCMYDFDIHNKCAD